MYNQCPDTPRVWGGGGGGGGILRRHISPAAPITKKNGPELPGGPWEVPGRPREVSGCAWKVSTTTKVPEVQGGDLW